jgi:hypothetical protein
MSWLISLPEETAASVIALVVAVIGVLLRLVISRVPWLEFLEKYKEEWGVALGIMLVNILNANLPGGEWETVSIIAVQLVVAVIGVLLAKFGAQKTGLLKQ